MTTITINIDNEKAEKAIRSVVEALGLSYDIENENDDRELFSKMEKGKKLGRASKQTSQAFLNRLENLKNGI